MMQMERRIYYDEVEGLSVEWLEATGTLVLDACRNKPAQRRGNQMKSRPIEEVAMVVNPSETMLYCLKKTRNQEQQKLAVALSSLFC